MASLLSARISFSDLLLDCHMLEPGAGVGPYLTFRLDVTNLSQNLTRELYLPIEGILLLQEPSGKSAFISRVMDQTPAEKPLSDLRLPFNDLRSFFLFSPLSWEAVTEIIARFGANESLKLALDLRGGFLEAIGSINQRMYGFTPSFGFILHKSVWERWVSGWTTVSLAVELSGKTPREVVVDFVESLKCLNIGALKGAVAMARRCLELATDLKGAKGASLAEKLKDLKNNGVLSDPDYSLASGVRSFGNYGAHPQDDLLKTITRSDAEMSITVTKHLVNKLFS
jgi:hypothetical protein